MTITAARRKRPCRICRCWFIPNPRVGARQKTCGKKECKREWHRKKCAEWNRNNAAYFKANYLQEKLESRKPGKTVPSAAPTSSPERLRCGIKSDEFQEVISPAQAVFVEYIIRLHIDTLINTLKIHAPNDTG